jgi:hypothetical protein
MQLVSNNFQLTSTRWKLKRWEKIINSIQYKCEVLSCCICLINDGECKMQHMNIGFNMLKVNGSTHIPCWQLRKYFFKNHQPIIAYCVNKVKGYLNFYVNNLNLLKYKIRSKLYT